MNEGDPRSAPHAHGVGARTVLARLGIGAVVIVAIIATGLEIYHNQRDKAGMPVVMASVPPPRETAAPSVEDVVTRLEKAVQATPGDAVAWRNLGWSYFQRGQFAQSADALRHATDIDPTDARTLSFLGEAILQAHKGQLRMPWEARAAFDEALKLDPKDARARYYRAFGWDLAGQHRRAINGWFALLQDTPPDEPYAADIRAVIQAVGTRHHIKVDKRLADVQFVPQAPASTSTRALATAKTKGHAGTGAIPGPAGDLMRAVEGVPGPAASDAAKNK